MKLPGGLQAPNIKLELSITPYRGLFFHCLDNRMSKLTPSLPYTGAVILYFLEPQLPYLSNGDSTTHSTGLQYGFSEITDVKSTA